MDTLTKPQYSAISEHSSVKGTPKAIRDWLMSCLPDSPASPSASLESKLENQTKETSGPKRLSASASYDPASHSWKTSQASLLTDTFSEFSETWPRAGMIVAGRLFRRLKWERRINEIGSGFLPTPNSRDGLGYYTVTRHHAFNRDGKMDHWVMSALRMKQYSHLKKCWANPRFSELMMGWPTGSTALKPLVMDRCLNVWRRPGIS